MSFTLLFFCFTDSGHFVTLIRSNNEFFVVNDVKPNIVKAKLSELEESDLFFFKKIDPDAQMG